MLSDIITAIWYCFVLLQLRHAVVLNWQVCEWLLLLLLPLPLPPLLLPPPPPLLLLLLLLMLLLLMMKMMLLLQLSVGSMHHNGRRQRPYKSAIEP